MYAFPKDVVLPLSLSLSLSFYPRYASRVLYFRRWIFDLREGHVFLVGLLVHTSSGNVCVALESRNPRPNAVEVHGNEIVERVACNRSDKLNRVRERVKRECNNRGEVIRTRALSFSPFLPFFEALEANVGFQRYTISRFSRIHRINFVGLNVGIFKGYTNHWEFFIKSTQIASSCTFIFQISYNILQITEVKLAFELSPKFSLRIGREIQRNVHLMSRENSSISKSVEKLRRKRKRRGTAQSARYSLPVTQSRRSVEPVEFDVPSWPMSWPPRSTKINQIGHIGAVLSPVWPRDELGDWLR